MRVDFNSPVSDLFGRIDTETGRYRVMFSTDDGIFFVEFARSAKVAYRLLSSGMRKLEGVTMSDVNVSKVAA